MKVSIINSSETTESDYGAIKVRELIDAKNSQNMSVVIVDLDGVNKRNKNKKSDMFYFVLEGKGIFNIEGKEYPVKKNSLIVIPKNTIYFDRGKMKMLSFCSPRFDPNSVEYLD